MTVFFITINSSVQPLSQYYDDFRLSPAQLDVYTIIRGQWEDIIYGTALPQLTLSRHFILIVLHFMLYMYIQVNWK